MAKLRQVQSYVLELNQEEKTALSGLLFWFAGNVDEKKAEIEKWLQTEYFLDDGEKFDAEALVKMDNAL